MFGNLVLFNKNKIRQYKALITGKSEVSILDDSFDKTNIDTYLLECDNFEKLLHDREDFYDFVNRNTETSLKDIRLASIIKVSGEIYVPEEFDMVQLIDEHKSIILNGLEYKDEDERELFETIFKKSKMKIPIYCELNEECDYWLGIGKVTTDELLVDYNDLEDYEGQTVNIIARLEARKYHKDKPLSVFDIYKDFLGLNRTLRKQIDSDTDQKFEKITVEEDYLALELLAIYT